MNKTKIFDSFVNLFFSVCVLVSAQAVAAQTCINLGGANSAVYTTNFDALGTSPVPRIIDADNLYNITNVAPAATKRFLGKYDNATNDAGNAVNFPGWALVEEGANIKSVSGRGTGISGVRITLTDAAGNSRAALTNSSGYYRFRNLPVGTYILNVRSKRFAYNSTQVLTFNEDRQDVNFTIADR